MKNNIQNPFEYLISVLPLAFLAKIFFPWFVINEISGGDFPYYGKRMLDGFTVVAPLWIGQNGIGLGGVNPNFPLFTYLYFTIGLFVDTLHIPWEITYKFMWFALPLVLGVIGMIYAYRAIKKDASLWEISLSIFLYLCNSYFLLISGGGQSGVVFAYAITPLVVGSVIRGISVLMNQKNFTEQLRSSIIFGFFLSLQVFFDSRIAFLTLGICLLYSIFHVLFVNHNRPIRLFAYLSLGLGIVFLLHSYWIVSFYFFKLLVLPKGITTGGNFTFFSFADFSHAFSLLHPNWPENIFGKTYFLQSEFLLYPFLAFLGLVVLKKIHQETRLHYLFFALIALIGVFLSKGVNVPFSGINIWLFSHIPGFNLFRDPTKFYLLVSLSYALMIPLTVKVLADFLKKKSLQMLFIIGIIISVTIPVRQAVLGKLGGTFTYVPVPNEYIQLADFFAFRSNFFRTLWIPTQSRFRFASENHTMLVAEDILGTSTPTKIVQQLAKQGEQEYLENLGIQYIVVPDDTVQEIFLTDRAYDDSKRVDLIKQLDTIPYLNKKTIGKIVLYGLPNPKDHFYLEDGTKTSYRKISTSEYTVTVHLATPEKLIFAESFHPGWIVVGKNIQEQSIRTSEGLNSFLLPPGHHVVYILFLPDQYEKYFYIFSGISFFIFIGFLIFSKRYLK